MIRQMIAAALAVGSLFAATALPAEASSHAARKPAAAHMVNPHAGMRCATYSHVKRGQHRQCLTYVRR